MTETEGPSKGANGQPFEPSANPAAQPQRPPTRRVRLSYIIVGAVLGTLVAGLIAAVLLIALLHDPTPLLTQEEFDAAETRWEEHGPKSYNLDVLIGGKRAGKVHIEVRNGDVTKMLRDGVQPKQKRTWGVWTVPGQFDMIGLELESARNPAAGFQAPAGSQVIQRAVFDAKYGYPRRYSREVLRTDIEVSWETINFQTVE